MRATCWSDYLCPWCYVGQDRSERMERLGVQVEHLPFELHPEIPAAGRPIRADGRLAPTFARVAAECEQLGLPWRSPQRMPNTRRALATAEQVRRAHPQAFAAVHRAIFAAHFAEGRPIDDPEVLDQLVAEAGAPADEVRAAVEDGRADAAVRAAMDAARATGVSSTPTWVLDDGFIVPGALDGATLERWLAKIVARRSEVDPSEA